MTFSESGRMITQLEAADANRRSDGRNKERLESIVGDKRTPKHKFEP